MQETGNNNGGGRLHKELGLFSGVSLVAGMTIGSGIYYLGSYVLERVNMSMGMALICWIVGGIVSILGAITLIYTLFNLAIYRVIPQAEVNSMVASGNVYLGRETAFRLMGNVGKWIVLIGMFIGIIGTVNGDCLVFPRTYYAMSKGGYFFKSMGTTRAYLPTPFWPPLPCPSFWSCSRAFRS